MIAVKLSSVMFLLGIIDISSQHEQNLTVSCSLGIISGYQKISRHGKEYEAYEGIPYAKPPVGKLRFQPPQPAERWSGELPAMEKGSACTQFLPENMAVDGDRVTGSEDCLYINIYVPIKNSRETLLPVIFWIHGGAYEFGSGNEMNESLIMDRDIVLVTVNYRLGPFGFLSTGDSEVPGNMGLKDQSMALRWVSNNIENFGGNPKNITLMGSNAGGVSVHYHYLSPLSAGLFQRGISISGVALDPWARVVHARATTRELGLFMGCATSRIKKIVNCLQTRPARLLSLAVGDFKEWLFTPGLLFGPVVEERGPYAFISRPPIEIINSGDAYDVPWISGVVKEEALYITELIDNKTLIRHLNNHWDDIAPYLLGFYDTVPRSQYKRLAEKIRKHYLGSEPFDDKTLTTTLYMISHRMFEHGFEKAVRLQAEKNKSPVWSYYYNYKPTPRKSELMSNSINNLGVNYSDDIRLVIDSYISDVTEPQDVKMQQILLDFYTSFAIEGKPRVGHADWQPLNLNDKEFHYLNISNPESIKMEFNPDFAQKHFWDSINFNENKVH